MNRSRGLGRRDFLALAGLAVGAATGMTGCSRSAESMFAPVGVADLPIPPLAPARREGRTRMFTLRVAKGSSRLVAGRPDLVTETMGYNGPFLGPTLRAVRGEQVHVTVRNDLDEATTLHWHGMHLPAVLDGGPHTPIAAGAEAHVEWLLDQPAATLWYHPHPHGQTEVQVLKGLAGMFLVDDATNLTTGLPGRYGIDDVPVILQDRYLDSAGRIVQVDDTLGTIGATLLANGLSGARFTVATELVRLRLLNGCSGRFLELRFDDDREFTMIATDGGLLTTPVPLRRLLLGPAERAEILVGFAAGDRVRLRTERPVIPGVRAEDVLDQMIAGDLVEFQAAARLAPAEAWSLPGPQRTHLDPAQASRTRGFELRMPFLNGQLMDLARIDAIVKLGDTEVWTVSTTDPFPHTFHVHDVQFLVVDINGAPPPAQLAGWKDTVPVLPGQTSRLVMRFTDYTDDRVPYMVHCHMLQHEDKGMMGQFLVTTHGTGPSLIEPAIDHPGHR